MLVQKQLCCAFKNMIFIVSDSKSQKLVNIV